MGLLRSLRLIAPLRGSQRQLHFVDTLSRGSHWQDVVFFQNGTLQNIGSAGCKHLLHGSLEVLPVDNGCIRNAISLRNQFITGVQLCPYSHGLGTLNIPTNTTTKHGCISSSTETISTDLMLSRETRQMSLQSCCATTEECSPILSTSTKRSLHKRQVCKANSRCT